MNSSIATEKIPTTERSLLSLSYYIRNIYQQLRSPWLADIFVRKLVCFDRQLDFKMTFSVGDSVKAKFVVIAKAIGRTVA